jgi:hypothetical protein
MAIPSLAVVSPIRTPAVDEIVTLTPYRPTARFGMNPKVPRIEEQLLFGALPFVLGRIEPLVGVIVYNPPTGLSQPPCAGKKETERDIEGMPDPEEQPAVSSAPPCRSNETVNRLETVDSQVLTEILRGESPLADSLGEA